MFIFANELHYIFQMTDLNYTKKNGDYLNQMIPKLMKNECHFSMQIPNYFNKM